MQELAMLFIWLSFRYSGTICTDSIYSILNKACYFEGISKQLATVSVEYVGIFHDKNKTGLTLYIK